MNVAVARMVAHLRQAERALARDALNQQRQWNYRVHKGRAWFEAEVRDAHARLRQSIPAFLRGSSLRNLLTTPFIYSLSLPFLLLDAWTTAYQWVCFPIYGIALVPRRSFVVIDRHRLSYLNGIEKANCAYCSYINGLIAYVREIAARTEQYWCPIKNSRRVRAPHGHYPQFVDYGDAAGYHQQLPVLRSALARRAGGRTSRSGSGPVPD